MNIKQIKITNFRLLKTVSIDLEKGLSLIIGKNNTGKTSFLVLLERFLIDTENTFVFEDFHIEYQKKICKEIECQVDKKDFKLQLDIIIEYFEDDNLENIGDFILNLNPDNNILQLSFEYCLPFEKLSKIKEKYRHFKKDFEDKTLIDFLKKYHKNYFERNKKVVEYENESNYIFIEDKQIRKIINLQTISAKREVANEEGGRKNNKTLSKLSFDYFEASKYSNDDKVTGLQKELMKTDDKLNDSYKEIFKEIRELVEDFGYNKDESKIEIMSNLEELNILKRNTSVMYQQNEHFLPEHYNGLGYMNLFALIFRIHIIFEGFAKKTGKPSEKSKEIEKPSDINLLFIEEPEAHTHPQMQYVFIKKIDTLLEKGKEKLNKKTLQTVITTHSAHITSQSHFNGIKYFSKNIDNTIIVKNLSVLEEKYGTKKENFKFLKQYLTLNNSELFFADKIIFIEGDTERLLLPAMMKKLDKEEEKKKLGEMKKINEVQKEDNYKPLLSQNISMVHVGANSKIFDEFLVFLDIKTLIITDIDSVKPSQNGSSCPVSVGTHTKNYSIRHFLNDMPFSTLKSLSHQQKILSKISGEWKQYVKEDKKDKEMLCIAYQTKEENNSYHGRSFEDAFISLNLTFIESKKDEFRSFKKYIKEKDKDKVELGDAIIKAKETNDYYDLANDYISKKTDFAIDILYCGEEYFSNLHIPTYIKEGLLWLSK